MGDTFEHAALERASSPTRLLEFNRRFQQLYAYRLLEIMLEQQQFDLEQQLWPSTAITPPLSPTSITDDQSRNDSSSERSSSIERSSAPQKHHTRTKIRFNPYQLQRRPKHLSAIQAKDSVEVDLRYNENMVRSYYRSTEHRTPEEIKRLAKNAYTGRICRAKTRALETLLKTEHDETVEQNRSQKLIVAQKRVYVNGLYQLLGFPQRDLAAEWEQYEFMMPEQQEL